MPDVRSSFAFTPRNASGAIQNGIAVLDAATNAAQTITATEKMNAVDIGNRTDNYIHAAVSLEDDSGTASTADVFLFPGASEAWSFEGRFITAVAIQAVDEPTATSQDASSLTASATAVPGIVDVNLIET